MTTSKAPVAPENTQSRLVDAERRRLEDRIFHLRWLTGFAEERGLTELEAELRPALVQLEAELRSLPTAEE